MGRGDIKTKKGKIANGSYGVRRPKNDDKPNDHKPPAVKKKA
ncbi:MAG: 30S ribosomal protein THX [Cytophagales bacterium CG12_big_fil_rev_8_21_14_0_65_40_12]|nr:MAG: 30S ribosomal protein THX [Cytophagales bacterium CG12_big_fil_rev_8_21_14_0_65_40_12]PIW03326.1 MAG: 30S ribosomal protein THX [Cytophagales bacterium CG17_big_fil_post_rev_8_21_14_2_50_40_13]